LQNNVLGVLTKHHPETDDDDDDSVYVCAKNHENWLRVVKSSNI